MDLSETIHFLKELRAARQQVLRDAEAAEAVIFAVEKLGRYESGPQKSLAKYRPGLSKLARATTLHSGLPELWPHFHISFDQLFDSLLRCRNDAMHQGVAARNFAAHAVQFALILEDALLSKLMKVSDVMVRNPVVAETWQPLSFIRQVMLAESFSHLPVFWNEGWWLISDFGLASYLRQGKDHLGRDEKLAKKLLDVLDQKTLHATKPQLVHPEESLSKVSCGDLTVPVLAVEAHASDGKHRLLGIVSAHAGFAKACNRFNLFWFWHKVFYGGTLLEGVGQKPDNAFWPQPADAC